jgi:hypothetical protein
MFCNLLELLVSPSHFMLWGDPASPCAAINPKDFEGSEGLKMLLGFLAIIEQCRTTCESSTW